MAKKLILLIFLFGSLFTTAQKQAKIKSVKGKSNEIEVKQQGQDSALSDINTIIGDSNKIKITQTSNLADTLSSSNNNEKNVMSYINNGYSILLLIATLIGIIISFPKLKKVFSKKTNK